MIPSGSGLGRRTRLCQRGAHDRCPGYRTVHTGGSLRVARCFCPCHKEQRRLDLWSPKDPFSMRAMGYIAPPFPLTPPALFCRDAF